MSQDDSKNNIDYINIERLIEEHRYYEAISMMVERYQSEITQYCIGMMGNIDDGLDVAQDVFISAYQALDRYKPVSTVRTWLFAIARNQCRHYFRNRMRRIRTPREENDIARLSHSDPQAIPGNSFPEQERIEIISNALERLSADERSILLMRYRHGLTTSAIAEIDGVSRRTIERRMRTAIDKLKQFVDDVLSC